MGTHSPLFHPMLCDKVGQSHWDTRVLWSCVGMPQRDQKIMWSRLVASAARLNISVIQTVQGCRDLVTDYWCCRFPVILASYCSNSPFKNLQIQQKKTMPTEGRHIVVQEMFSTFGDQTEPSNVTLTLYLKQPFLAKGEFWSQIAPRLSLRPICLRLSCQNWDKENTTCILNSWYCILLKMIWLTIFEVLEVGTSQSELTTKVDFRLLFEKQGFYARNKMWIDPLSDTATR